MECMLGLFAALFGAFFVFLGIINPEMMESKDTSFIPIMGGVFIVVGIYVFMTTRKKFFGKVYFWTHKIDVDAEIVGVEIKTTSTINGKHPYVLKCQWTNPETGITYNFTSGTIAKNPEPYLNDIRTIEVSFLLDDPVHYKVNTKKFKETIGY